MIAHEVVKIQSVDQESPPMFLAPFGQKELRNVLPLHPDLLPFLLQGSSEVYTNPEAMLSNENALTRTTTFGIYTNEVTPDQFKGIVMASEVDGMSETGFLKEVGTVIMHPEERGKNYGTLAKVALMAYRFESDTNIHAFRAVTAEGNTVAQRSLHKAGLTRIDTHDYANFMDHTQKATQEWWLADPAIQKGLAENEPHLAEPLAAGWQRYLDYRHTITLSSPASSSLIE